ncbi:MAG: metal ABC transporter permease [Synechococcaceae cyanobacterium]|jgi:zinc transport system permease protein
MTVAASLGELLALPFLQRALLAGCLSGALGGLLGSFAVLRQLSFFTDALGHSALLGIALGVLLGLDPTLVLIPFAVLFALGVNQLARRSRLPADALLNIIYSSSLALAVVALSRLPGWKGGLDQLLFGDILGVTTRDLLLLAALLLATATILLVTGRRQMLLTIDASLALSRGVAAEGQRLLFVVLLAVVVALSIKAVGVLLISAFVVIPACASRLISGNFRVYLLLSALFGATCAVLGLIASAAADLPSGPSVVVVQLLLFLLALGLSGRGTGSPKEVG